MRAWLCLDSTLEGCKLEVVYRSLCHLLCLDSTLEGCKLKSLKREAFRLLCLDSTLEGCKLIWIPVSRT